MGKLKTSSERLRNNEALHHEQPRVEDPIKRSFRELWNWIQRFLGQRKPSYRTPTILKEYNSTFCRLLLLERHTSRAVRTWRGLLRYSGEHDLLLTTDTLESLPGEKPVFKSRRFATHRLSVCLVARIPSSSGRVRVDCLFMGDFDFVGTSGLAWGVGNRYAICITDSIANEILHNRHDEIDWLEKVSEAAKKFMHETLSL